MCVCVCVYKWETLSCSLDKDLCELRVALSGVRAAGRGGLTVPGLGSVSVARGPGDRCPAAGGCWAVTQALSTAGKAGLCPGPRGDYSHDGKGEGQRAPELCVLLPPDGRSEDSTGSWGWSVSLLTPLGRFSRAGPRKVGNRGPRQLTLPWEPAACLALPDCAHPWPNIRFPYNEEIGLALLKAGGAPWIL